jgi:hypothetical protein
MYIREGKQKEKNNNKETKTKTAELAVGGYPLP